MIPPTTFTRRNFLRSTVLAALAPTAARAAEPEAHRHHQHIDAHVHVWTPDTHRYPLAPTFSRKDMAPPSFTPRQLFAQCNPSGVQRIVLIQMSFYHYDNRYMLDRIREYPGTFRGVAIIDENKPRLRETMKTLRGQGVRGFRLYADKKKVAGWKRSEGMKEIWAHAADLNMSMCLLADPGALPGVTEMCEAYPRTPVVIDHFARIGMKGPIRQRDLDRLCSLAQFPHTHVKTSAFYALGAKKAPYTDLGPMVRRLRDAYGASRLMWGSDCPFQVQDGHTYANSFALIRDRLDFLSAEDKRWMLGGTAEKVFFA
jgi:predicted TIM-barrel fold metal-dependent hydrolase